MGLVNSRQVFAKQLRRNMTDAELLLWRHLRGHRLLGVKFKRQQPLGNYIVDFVCFGNKLVIEVDGGQHLDNRQDQQRDTWLRSQGFEVLRFWNNEVLEQTEAVLERIFQVLSPSPQPLSDGTTSHSTRLPKGVSQVAGYREGRGAKNLERVRWRARRGLLELDIVLGRFIEQHYAGLDEAQQAVFDALLDMPDNPLWDMIAGRQEAAQSEQQALLEKIRAV